MFNHISTYIIHTHTAIPNKKQQIFAMKLQLLFLLCQIIISSAQICPPLSCNPTRQDTILFPFYVPQNQSSRCGYPGFDLTCGSNGRTLVNISSKPLIIQGINYLDQVMLVSDPNLCIPNHVLNQNLTSTPYSYGPDTPVYSFLNCSNTNGSSLDLGTLPVGTSVVKCLSGDDYTVITAFEKGSEEHLKAEMKCEVVKRVNAVFLWDGIDQGLYPADMSDVLLMLNWNGPNCHDCLANGGYCWFSNRMGLSVDCYFPTDSSGIPKSAKYGLIIGAGVPLILCIIGLTYHISGRVRARNQNQHRQHPTTVSSSPTIFPQPVILTVGLDRPTIESYPKTILGESKRLPKNSDNTCPICLSEYQPKETLKSIPECNHYFHSDCIDEWLRINASCPLCRKSPQQ